MIEDKRVCENCGHPIHRKPYLMALDPDKPGAVGILRGEAGARAKVLLTIAICVLAVLIVAGLESL